jgi:hypothetical protein
MEEEIQAEEERKIIGSTLEASNHLLDFNYRG